MIAGDAACVIDAGDKAWLKAAPGAWRLVERNALGLKPMSPRPAFVFYDGVCAYRSSDGKAWAVEAHGGTVKMPDGSALPPQVASFAAPTGDGGAFMVMGLPSVWRAGDVKSELGLEKLMFAVFDHEMAHTRQFADWSARIDALAAKGGFGDDLTDDVVQDRFASDAAFTASVKRESELLFAAQAMGAADARRTVAEALDLMLARRSKWFVGDAAIYGELEDVFLTLEGVGQFAGYSWLADAKGGAIAREQALPQFRRGGRRWSQDEGLAIYLAIDRLVPGWQAMTFGSERATALQLLALAAGRG